MYIIATRCLHEYIFMYIMYIDTERTHKPYFKFVDPQKMFRPEIVDVSALRGSLCL